jgi:hypothetical protein
MDEKKIGKLRKFFATKDSKNPRLDIRNPFDRYLMLAESNRIWKKTFVCTFLLLLISLCGNINQSVNRQDRIIKVEVDKGTGGIISTSYSKTNDVIDERQITYFLNKFILDVRSIPLDNAFYNNRIKEASYFLTAEAQNKLKKIIEEEKVSMKFFNRETVNVKLLSFNKITNTTNTYQIRWQEITFNDQGAEIEKALFVSSLTIDFIKPDTDEIKLINPFGLVIKDFTISKEK